MFDLDLIGREAEMARVMVVEDEHGIREMLARFFEYKGHSVVEATDGREALEKLDKEDVDIVFMDISMPGIDGITATKAIRDRGYPAMVIILTAFTDEKRMKEAAEAGADDFIGKPVDLSTLSARLMLAERHLPFYKFRHTLTARLFLAKKTSSEALKKLASENRQLTMELIETLYNVSEYRDDETHEHTMRVGWLSGRIAEKLGQGAGVVTKLQFAAPLHDLGKIGIPDRILLKPDKLSEEEYELMKTHTIIGHSILSRSTSSILKCAAEIALTHHERWDGTGYPNGFQGEEIPLVGAIVAVADSFDAIVSERPYKKARPLDEAFDELKQLAGSWYRPDIVGALLELEDEVRSFYGSVKGHVQRDHPEEFRI
ncbi:MAG: two-component system response regulator [Thermotogae bacterium]|nr:MAG: two-component system response regulator [Thermotogota bacterium]